MHDSPSSDWTLNNTEEYQSTLEYVGCTATHKGSNRWRLPYILVELQDQ